MSPELLAIVIAFIGSNAIFSFITFLINRRDLKKRENTDTNETIEALKEELNTLKEEFKKKTNKLEKDGLRLQLLVLIILKPESIQEIMIVAKRYFVDLKGDWYMTDFFNKWLKEHDIEIPMWLNQLISEEAINGK